MYFSGIGMIPLSASKVWLWVQRDGGFWSFLTWTKNHLSLHRHPEVSLEVVEETPLILQENLRPDCDNAAKVPSFTLRTALSTIQFVSDLCGVDMQWFQERSSGFAEFQGIASVNDFRHPLGLQELCNFISISCQVFVLYGYDWIHWVAKSCTTTAYRWLFRDSQLSLRTLWSAGIKSPKFTPRGTAPPLRLCTGPCKFGPFTDLTISVFWEMSINTVFTEILTSLRSRL